MTSSGTGGCAEPETATVIVRAHVDETLSVVDTRPLHGGMVSRVEEWITDGKPAAIVAKVTAENDDKRLHDEYASLDWCARYTSFTMPKPFACVSSTEECDGTILLMERLPGHNLGAARLTADGMRRLQTEMAEILADLHVHKRDTYGDVLEPAGEKRWVDVFGPQIGQEFSAVNNRFSSSARKTISGMLDDLDVWLPESGNPTLVHGDVWATNVMVDDSDPTRPTLTGFLDAVLRYTDVEYELAYLLVFNTADQTFFDEYARRHPLRDGFDRRCRVYWLNTMLLHMRVFGTGYLPACERLAQEIERLA
jgi:fructosamine-3-kinase